MHQQVIKNPIEPIKRIIIKIGSALMVDSKKVAVRKKWLSSLAEDVAMLQAQDKQVIIVSSGATALGRKVLGFGMRELMLEERQASAACGQILLMKAWQEALAEQKLKAAQVLLTADDTETRKRFINARHTIDTLIANKIIPIVNENDVITAKGYRVGDNDRLAARVAQMINAGLLILLSDVDGLYSKDPTKHKDAQHVPLVPEITKAIRSMAGTARSMNSSGGMKTKVQAAEIAAAAGCHMVICEGDVANPITRLTEGARHTLFLGKENPLSAKKHWILGALEPRGIITIDDGAVNALNHGNSLLPMGVTNIEGEFSRGDAVWIVDKEGLQLAKGLSSYNSDDAERIQGRHSDQIKEILGFKARNVLIHRDDMVMIE